jgi:hypothetical protein
VEYAKHEVSGYCLCDSFFNKLQHVGDEVKLLPVKTNVEFQIMFFWVSP